ncbi:hypothetical protein PSP6_750003 [Paraburkholderia tropica]|nr:hypothetical protein PSP6_750003 [Paraburkholderia tropica]
MIDAPFTPDQVQILNERQCDVETLVPIAHPFTSPHRSDERHERCGGDLGHPTLARNRGNKAENPRCTC